MSEKITKNCIGCKTPKEFSSFHKNKSTIDGYSQYCKSCTKENAKRYFQRKKENKLKKQAENYINLSLLSNSLDPNLTEETENLLRLMKIENLLNNLKYELNVFKNQYEKTKNLVTI